MMKIHFPTSLFMGIMEPVSGAVVTHSVVSRPHIDWNESDHVNDQVTDKKVTSVNSFMNSVLLRRSSPAIK